MSTIGDLPLDCLEEILSKVKVSAWLELLLVNKAFCHIISKLTRRDYVAWWPNGTRVNKNPFLAACKQGHYLAVVYFSQQPANKRWFTNWKSKGLKEAAQSDALEGLRLVNWFLTFKAVDSYHAFLGACAADNLELVIKMQKKDNHPWKLGLQPAVTAESGKVSVHILEELNKSNDLLSGGKVDVFFVLISAISHKNLPAVKWLWPKLSSIKSKRQYDSYFADIKFFAIKGGHPLIIDMVKNLCGDISEETILKGAAAGGHLELLKTCAHLTNIDDALREACRHGQLNSVRYLVEKGAKINNKHLFWACFNENITLIKYLLAVVTPDNRLYGLALTIIADHDINLLSSFTDKEPLELTTLGVILNEAAKRGALEVVDWCIERGANSQLALNYALHNDCFDIANEMLKLGATAPAADLELIRSKADK